MTQPQHKPQWSGLTLQIGSNVHVLPLYEDDRIHNTMGICPCEPEVTTKHGELKYEPDWTVYTHKPIRAKQ